MHLSSGIRVTSSKQFFDLVEQFKEKWNRVYTNCFFLPEQVEAYVNKNELSYILENDALMILVDTTSKYNFFYYLSEESKFSQTLASDKPVVLDILYRKSRIPKEFEQVCSIWRACGFRDYEDYFRMKLVHENMKIPEDMPNLLKTDQMTYSYSRGKESLAEEISALWGGGLDQLGSPFPSPDEIRELIASDELRCMLDESGRVAAVMLSLKKGKNARLYEKMVVSEEHRQRGLARFLFTRDLREVLNEGNTIIHFWVLSTNKLAIDLYRRIGFVEEGLCSKQFVV